MMLNGTGDDTPSNDWSLLHNYTDRYRGRIVYLLEMRCVQMYWMGNTEDKPHENYSEVVITDSRLNAAHKIHMTERCLDKMGRLPELEKLWQQKKPRP
jgi:hypothetical protein